MKVLLDCDVLLDVALHREPHFDDSSRLLDLAQAHPGQMAVAWHTFSNLAYLAKPGALEFIKELCQFVEIPETGSRSMELAFSFGMKDFEDAMQVAAAVKFQAQLIATRNVADYKDSPIQALVPGDVLPLF